MANTSKKLNYGKIHHKLFSLDNVLIQIGNSYLYNELTHISNRPITNLIWANIESKMSDGFCK